MASIVVLAIIVAIALLAPLIARLSVSPRTTSTPRPIDNAGGLPIGWGGGISKEHLLGVEPGTGRDIFARLLYGSRISLLIALSATTITVVLGVSIGIIAGYSRGWLDAALGRLMDLILAFPLILILLALSNVLTQRLQTTFHLGGQPARVLYLILVLSFFGWPYLARIVRGQVLSLREREFVESAVSHGRGHPAHPVPRDPAQSVGADPRLLHPAAAHLHRGRGDSVVPRRRPCAADPVLGRDAG